MVSSAFDPLRVPDEFWARDDVGRALKHRDFGELFRLLSKHLGASQTRIGTATGLAQGTVCVIMNGTRHMSALDVLERIADGLAMPDTARTRLGLAPRGTPPAVPDTPDTAGTNGGADPPGGSELMVPHHAPASAALTGLPLPDHVAVALLQPLESLASSLATPGERDRAYHQLVQVLRRWAHTMDRRDALRLLGWAVTAASAAATLDGDEYERVVSVLSGQSRIDTQTIEHIETVLWSCRRQDHALGPHAALDTVLAQRQLAGSLLAHCPDPLRPELLSALSEASRLAGWLSFDLNQFNNAGYYYSTRTPGRAPTRRRTRSEGRSCCAR